MLVEMQSKRVVRPRTAVLRAPGRLQSKFRRNSAFDLDEFSFDDHSLLLTPEDVNKVRKTRELQTAVIVNPNNLLCFLLGFDLENF